MRHADLRLRRNVSNSLALGRVRFAQSHTDGQAVSTLDTLAIQHGNRPKKQKASSAAITGIQIVWTVLDMDIKMNNQLVYPPRNEQTENEIDSALAFETISIQSLRVYLDAIAYLLDRYHDKPAIHTMRNLVDFIRRDKIKLSFHEKPRSLGYVHTHFLEQIDVYLKNLKTVCNVRYGNLWDDVDQLIDYLERQITQTNASNEDIKNLLSQLQMHSDHHCRETGDNLAIFLNYPEIIIYVVRTWDDYEIPASRHLVSLIDCTTSLNEVPDHVFADGRLRAISSRNQSNRFECINLRSPIQQCISMVDTSIARLNWKHADLKGLISSFNSLYWELKNLNLYINKFVGPEGNFVLENVKRRIRQVHPVLDSFEGLPDTESIRFVRSKLEQIAFSLSSLHSSLSIKLNTKKYIIGSLNQIIKNDGLYKHKQKKRLLENAFSEANLTSILASNLSCFYHFHEAITVQTEVQMGAGVADVVVTYKGNISTIIEGKLVTDLNQTKAKVLDGLSQLYNRYGDHNSIIDTFGVELYLVVFAYDQRLAAMAKLAYQATEEFAAKHQVRLEPHSEGNDYHHFSFVDKREGSRLPEKRRSIFILYCNMEVEKKDEHTYAIVRKPKLND